MLLNEHDMYKYTSILLMVMVYRAAERFKIINSSIPQHTRNIYHAITANMLL